MQRQSGSSRALVMGAIGVVFGDIGTSPLYTLREGLKGLAPSSPNVNRVVELGGRVVI
nr:KUP/HAK/KT family potassium transporter [Paraburkholderia sp. UCT31]